MLKNSIGSMIIIEGCDGSGKTTVAKALVEKLKAEGFTKVDYCRSPGGSTYGEEVRKIAFNHNDLCDDEFAMLFLSGMLHTVRNDVLPKLNDGYIVIMDRFYRSTYIYQRFYELYDNNNDIDFSNYNPSKRVVALHRIRERMFKSIRALIDIDIAKYMHTEFILKIPTYVAYTRIVKRKAPKSSFENKCDLRYVARINDIYDSITIPSLRSAEVKYNLSNKLKIKRINANRNVNEIVDDMYYYVMLP